MQVRAVRRRIDRGLDIHQAGTDDQVGVRSADILSAGKCRIQDEPFVRSEVWETVVVKPPCQSAEIVGDPTWHQCQ